MKLSECEREYLDALLAKATGGGEIYRSKDTDLLLTVGKGIFWSQKLHEKAIALAYEIEEEFRRFSNAESFK